MRWIIAIRCTAIYVHITPCYVPLFAIFSPCYILFFHSFPHFFLIPAISSDQCQAFFSLPDSLANVPFCHRRGRWGGPVMATHSHFTCQAKARPIIVPGPSSPSSSVLPPASLTGTLGFSDSSSIGWASSLIGVAVCGWLGSVKESPERGTGRWMDSRVTAPGAEGWLLCIITAGKREMDSYTQSQIHSHINTHHPVFPYTLILCRYECILVWIFSLA